MKNHRKIANRATLTEAAEICDVSRHSLRDAVANNRIPYHLVRRRIASSRYGKPYTTVRRVVSVDLDDVEAWKATRSGSRTRQAVEMFKRGLSRYEIAEEMGIKPHSAVRLLNRAGYYFSRRAA